mmetsp:Transcript_18346/g.32462  ORF Transcript_18346/g.32462 Transcript_18346/m.32462 type:complete len:200 (+) Transcript_18346:1652-2251(+)
MQVTKITFATTSVTRPGPLSWIGLARIALTQQRTRSGPSTACQRVSYALTRISTFFKYTRQATWCPWTSPRTLSPCFKSSPSSKRSTLFESFSIVPIKVLQRQEIKPDKRRNNERKRDYLVALFFRWFGELRSSYCGMICACYAVQPAARASMLCLHCRGKILRWKALVMILLDWRCAVHSCHPRCRSLRARPRSEALV